MPAVHCWPWVYSLGMVSRYSMVRSGTVTWREWCLWMWPMLLWIHLMIHIYPLRVINPELNSSFSMNHITSELSDNLQCLVNEYRDLLTVDGHSMTDCILSHFTESFAKSKSNISISILINMVWRWHLSKEWRWDWEILKSFTHWGQWVHISVI